MTRKLEVGNVFYVDSDWKGQEVSVHWSIGVEYEGKDLLRSRTIRIGESCKLLDHPVGFSLIVPEEAFIGRYYVVENAELAGGGTGHGPGDVYPDGWQVIARRLLHQKLAKLTYDEAEPSIQFYQSGAFTTRRDRPVVVVSSMKPTTVFR